MSRHIDQLPQPAKKTQVKVIVATASRTGTLSVYEAMKILGYKTYHMYECVIHGGSPHMEVLSEAIEAQYNRYSGIKRFNRRDFDKWLADYDCLVEVPYFMGPEVLEAYADDPNVKFILTDRDPDKWVTSVNNTAGDLYTKLHQFPLNVLKHFNKDVGNFMRLNQLIYGAISDCTAPGDEHNRDALRRNYVSYIEMAKRVLPADRLLYFRLEDGVLGWEKICAFLDVPIPDQKFPPPNDTENFKKVVGDWMNPRMQNAMLKLGAVVVPVVGSLAYFGIKYLSALRSGL